MARLIPKDHNLRVDGLSPSIKALITKLENAIDAYSWNGARPPEDREELKLDAQIARYNLEQAIATQIKKAEGK